MSDNDEAEGIGSEVLAYYARRITDDCEHGCPQLMKTPSNLPRILHIKSTHLWGIGSISTYLRESNGGIALWGKIRRRNEAFPLDHIAAPCQSTISRWSCNVSVLATSLLSGY